MIAGSTQRVRTAVIEFGCGGREGAGGLGFQQPQAARVVTFTSQTDRLEESVKYSCWPFFFFGSNQSSVFLCVCSFLLNATCRCFSLLRLLKFKTYCAAFAYACVFNTQLLPQRMGCASSEWTMLLLRPFQSVSSGENEKLQKLMQVWINSWDFFFAKRHSWLVFPLLWAICLNE